MPRRKRSATLSPIEAERFYRASIAYRQALLQLQTDLAPFGPHYSPLHDLTDALHRALVDIAGRELDFRKTDLGLLE